jgi:diguanylate cyclase (GGDEF)-like protein
MGFLGRLRRFQSRLGVRFTILFASVLTIFAIEFTAYSTLQSNRAIRNELERHVAYVGRFGADLVVDDLRNLRLRELLNVMHDFAARSDIVYARLLDKYRRVVTDGVGSTVAFSAVSSDDLYDAAEASRRIQISDDGAVVHVAQPVMRGNEMIGVLRFGVSLDAANQATRDLVHRNALIVLFFLGFVVPLVALIGRRATLPIRRLTEATRRIAAGDLATTIETGGNDEIAELGRSIETMVKNLSESAAAIRSLTFVDQLTGLPNREQLELRITAAIDSMTDDNERTALIIVDLDRFKRVNDALGPDHGDLVLREVADRLALVLEDWREAPSRAGGPSVETAVARLSADEFGVMIAGPLGSAELDQVLRRIMRSFDTDFDIDGHALDLKASLGVAVAPGDARDFKTLIQNAGVALEAAKTSGRANLRYFSADLDEQAYRRLMLETELRQALPRGELEVYYQPQVACADGAALGAEALIRWNHPTRGLVSPAEFIPLAEETGLILDIGTFVLRRVCAQAARWAEHGLLPRLSVNVSRAQFVRQDFAPMVLATLAEHGVEPSQLELEITESLVMANPDNVAGQMGPLRAAGVRFAMDDFGTGYSSLSVLTRLPFDVLKIDRSFVRGISDEADERAMLVKTVIGMAHGLGLEVVAEGVETEAEHDFLRSERCNNAQGYLFARPLKAEHFETWFIVHRRHDARMLRDRLREALLELPSVVNN